MVEKNAEKTLEEEEEALTVKVAQQPMSTSVSKKDYETKWDRDGNSYFLKRKEHIRHAKNGERVLSDIGVDKSGDTTKYLLFWDEKPSPGKRDEGFGDGQVPDRYKALLDRGETNPHQVIDTYGSYREVMADKNVPEEIRAEMAALKSQGFLDKKKSRK